MDTETEQELGNWNPGMLRLLLSLFLSGCIFTKSWWRYVFAPKNGDAPAVWRVWWCRMNQHPAGVVWYTGSGGVEPDYHCKTCNDYLG